MSTNKQNLKIKLQQEMIEAGVWSCCHNCDHWGEDVNQPCGLFICLPPGEILATGCDQWIMKIPF